MYTNSLGFPLLPNKTCTKTVTSSLVPPALIVIVSGACALCPVLVIQLFVRRCFVPDLVFKCYVQCLVGYGQKRDVLVANRGGQCIIQMLRSFVVN